MQESGIDVFLKDFESFLTSDEKAIEMVYPPVKAACEHIRILKNNIETKIGALQFNPEEFDRKIQENLPKLERLKRRRDDVLGFIRDRSALLITGLEFTVFKHLSEKLTKISEYIFAWEDDLESLKKELPGFMKTELNEYAHNLINNIENELRFVQEETEKRVEDFKANIIDFQSSLTTSITSHLKQSTKAIEGISSFSFLNFAMQVGGGAGIGWFGAMVLMGPFGWIATIGAGFIWGTILGVRREKKQIEKLEREIILSLRNEIQKTIPKIQTRLKNNLGQLAQSVDGQLKSMLNSIEDTINGVKKERQMEEDALKKKINEYSSIIAELSSVENKLQRYLEKITPG